MEVLAKMEISITTYLLPGDVILFEAAASNAGSVSR